jgi:hypothetical protein
MSQHLPMFTRPDKHHIPRSLQTLSTTLLRMAFEYTDTEQLGPTRSLAWSGLIWRSFIQHPLQTQNGGDVTDTACSALHSLSQLPTSLLHLASSNLLIDYEMIDAHDTSTSFFDTIYARQVSDLTNTCSEVVVCQKSAGEEPRQNTWYSHSYHSLVAGTILWYFFPPTEGKLV